MDGFVEQGLELCADLLLDVLVQCRPSQAGVLLLAGLCCLAGGQGLPLSNVIHPIDPVGKRRNPAPAKQTRIMARSSMMDDKKTVETCN